MKFTHTGSIMNKQNFEIPFIFKMEVIKKRCRKPSTVYVQGIHSVAIQKIKDSDAILSFEVDINIKSEDKKQRIFTIPVVDGRLYQQTEEHFTQDLIGDVERPGLTNPFARSATTYQYFSSEVLDEKDISASDFRAVINSNRKIITDELDALAKNYIVGEKVTYTIIGEPYYCVHTMGLGNNNGGTVLNVAYTHSGKPQTTPAFNANQLDEAQSYADAVAKNRGDSKSIGIGPLYTINVHRPDDVILPKADVKAAS